MAGASADRGCSLTRAEAKSRQPAACLVDDDLSLTREQLIGKTVCFTGLNPKHDYQSRCSLRETPMTDKRAWDLVEACGMKWSERMRQKDVDVLVVAARDMDTDKVEDARRWGKLIVYEPYFWRFWA